MVKSWGHLKMLRSSNTIILTNLGFFTASLLIKKFAYQMADPAIGTLLFDPLPCLISCLYIFYRRDLVIVFRFEEGVDL